MKIFLNLVLIICFYIFFYKYKKKDTVESTVLEACAWDTDIRVEKKSRKKEQRTKESRKKKEKKMREEKERKEKQKRKDRRRQEEYY